MILYKLWVGCLILAVVGRVAMLNESSPPHVVIEHFTLTRCHEPTIKILILVTNSQSRLEYKASAVSRITG